MTFKVGQSGNPAGRPKGSKGKMATKLKEDIFESYERVGGVDYLQDLAVNFPPVYKDLLKMLIPAMTQKEIGRPGDFEDLTDDQLDERIRKEARNLISPAGEEMAVKPEQAEKLPSIH